MAEQIPNNPADPNLVALVMAGGSGTRFWPLSRRSHPKQVLNLGDHPSLLSNTMERLGALLPPERILVVTGEPHAKEVAHQCESLPDENLLIEPVGRDTAPCVGLGALVVRDRFDPSTAIGVFPADHHLQPRAEFVRNVRQAASVCRDLEAILTFGVEPDFPSTGYGYLHYDRETYHETDQSRVFRVEEFTEKPDRKTARRFLQSGEHLWNSGMFFWTAETILREIKRYMPDLYQGLDRMRSRRDRNTGWDSMMEEAYAELPKQSIDYGVLEHSRKVWTLPVEFSWSDLGTWDALEVLIDSDNRGNVTLGDVHTLDVSNSIVVAADRPVVASADVEDLVIVSTRDAVLVCSREKAERVKQLVEHLRSEGRSDLLDG